MRRRVEGEAWWERAALSILLLAGTCVGCAGGVWQSPVPLVGRPDTRKVIEWVVTQPAIEAAYQILLPHLPNESAFCFLGTTRPSVDGIRGHVDLVADTAVEARSDSADPAHVWFTIADSCTMKGALGIGHVHPMSVGRRCEHSDDDVLRLFQARALFSLVLCADGTGEVLWQDGRRVAVAWMEGVSRAIQRDGRSFAAGRVRPWDAAGMEDR